jgi:hypothetical protein
MHRTIMKKASGPKQLEAPQVIFSQIWGLRSRTRTAAATVVSAIILVNVCSAATMTLSASITGTYDLNAPNSQLAAGFLWDGQPHIYGVGIFAQVLNLQPPQSFGAAAFDVNLDAALSRITVTNANVSANYRANNPAMDNVFDQNGAKILNYFSGGDNADLGTSSTDLIGITIDLDSTTLGNTFDQNHVSKADPRQSIGVGAPFLLGSIFVRWDGTQNAQMTFANAAYQLVPPIGPPDIGINTAIAPAQFVVPEPAAGLLLAVGAAMCWAWPLRFFARAGV